MAEMDKKELKEIRKQKFAQMEQQLKEIHPKEEDSIFYYHSSEDRIILSHALFWTMTLPQYFKSKLRKEKFFLLLRQYQEELLDAFLQDDDYFSDLLHYCNILYEMLPTILMSSYYREEKDARKLAAISVVAAGFGGDMDEELCNELLDDMDFHYIHTSLCLNGEGTKEINELKKPQLSLFGELIPIKKLSIR